MIRVLPTAQWQANASALLGSNIASRTPVSCLYWVPMLLPGILCLRTVLSSRGHAGLQWTTWLVCEIFAPMVPLTETTHGLITREHLLALPRAAWWCSSHGPTGLPTLRERVLADEVSLAADVWTWSRCRLTMRFWRHNVVHTPHNAGARCIHQQWAEALAVQFDPSAPSCARTLLSMRGCERQEISFS